MLLTKKILRRFNVVIEIIVYQNLARVNSFNRTFHRFNNVSHTPPGEITPDESYSLETEFPLDSYANIRHTVMLSGNKAHCVTLVNDSDAILTVSIIVGRYVVLFIILNSNSLAANDRNRLDQTFLDK